MKPDAYVQLLVEARQAGAEIKMTSSGHWKITKDGATVYCAQTPSDTRALHNVRAELRRAGILPRNTNLQLTPPELEFLDRFGSEDKLRGEGPIPSRLLAKGFVTVSNRYRHGKPDGWVAWISQLGRRALEVNR